MVLTSTGYDEAGNPTQTHFDHVLRASQKTTLRNPYGFPTATLWYYDVESTATLYDSNHVATATVTTLIPETPVVSTFFDANGVPTKTTTLLQPIVTEVVVITPTPTSMPSSDNGLALKLRRTPDGMYFAGLMLPTLLAIFVSIPIRILNRNIKLYQGFQSLASSRGASAAKSLCLRTTGPLSILYGVRSLWDRQYVLGLTSLLVVLSALAIPFSTEAFPLILQGAQCNSDGSELECSVGLGVFPVYANVLSGLLIVLILGLVTVALLLRRWETGVERNPWSILEMTQLAAHMDMQGILERLRRRQIAGIEVNSAVIANALRAKTFGLLEWEERNGALNRGVLILLQEVGEQAENPVKRAGRSVTFAETGEARRRRLCSSGECSPFFMLSWTGRLVMISSLSGLLIAVLTYNILMRGSEDPAEVMGKAATVRFLFSGAGILVVFAWGSFFNAISFLSPYKLLRRKRLVKGNAININPATNPFTGLYVAFDPSRRDIYLGAVAATAILSEFLPLLLGNIACNGVPIERIEAIFVYLSVGVLSIMILVLGGSFFVDWPPMKGADPSTIAGAMYAAFSLEQPVRRFIMKEASSIV
ncbi:hypothetical protein F5Y08DRAFT_333024 [Xylaria arbuscula]|nr:hypothetical protein F5Y08DRAFT_333024 [Xylaria arbuscula]